MVAKLSSLFVRTLREDPHDAEVASHKLLVRASYIRRAAPGIYSWLPLGLRVLGKIEDIVREEMDRIGGQEVHFPALLPREPYETTGRWTEYGPNLFRLKDRRENDYLLAPTHEEMFTLLVKDMCSSYKDLPLTLYQIQTKYRDEARPRAGLIRCREFIMKDAYSFDFDDDGLAASYEAERGAYQRVFARLGLDVVICSAVSGAMGGSRSEEFLHPTPVGEDTFVRSAGGYAANAEAVTTVAPPPVAFDSAPPSRRLPTPGAATIEALVRYANEHYPREDRPWTAADTLKSLLVKLSHPGGEEELIVVGIPGDRELDMKRLEAVVSPALAANATDEDMARRPELVKGYMGPKAAGPNRAPRDSDGNGGGLRLLLDPRVVEGSSWITGGDEIDTHYFGLVMGRDFTADGIIEAAEVRAGDPAPDGSGPLELARGIEVGHIFQLGRKYAESLGLTVLDENGKSRVVTMGSYGIGVSRVLAAMAEANHDDAGLAWPVQIAPYHVHVVATGKNREIFDAAETLAGELESRGVEVLYDDRPRVSAGVKFTDAELLGVPYMVVVGRGLADGVVEFRDRRSGERREVAVAEAAERLAAQVEEALRAAEI
ncbi:MAG TPA: proline--tRNA ligase [Actinomycetaceae bacterium]|nr:proline--tRNA ligase [Actinomycetaceae bacterium]